MSWGCKSELKLSLLILQPNSKSENLLFIKFSPSLVPILLKLIALILLPKSDLKKINKCFSFKIL